MSDPKALVAVASATAQQALTESGTSPFSDPAFVTLKNQIEGYIGDLIDESSKIARRHRADTISSAHVEQAAEYLVSNAPRRVVRHIGTVGGILFGAGLSTVLSQVATGSTSTTGWLLAASFSAIGAFLVALHVAHD